MRACKITSNNLYDLYTKENPTVVTGNGRIRHRRFARPISKEKFVSIANSAQSDKVLSPELSREDAKKKLVNNVYGSMGFIEYFILKAIIMWIIEKILDYYFDQQ